MTQLPVLPMLPIERKPLQAAVKRASDLLLAFSALIVLSPVMLIAAAGILICDPGPVFYKARRMGKDMKEVTMYKFRTMRVGSDKQGAITGVNDSRVFSWGEILRKTKIDELPQLVNIIKGEMSVVGPRPEDVDIVNDYYTEKEKLTLKVLPGLACPGSIFNYTHGDKYLSGDDAGTAYTDRFLHIKLALDIYYLRHWSLAYDVSIIIRTVKAITDTMRGGKGADYPVEYKKIREMRRWRRKS
ncbi:MAG: sugar transferase [Lachnospiraceae bacterium]|nr:sugar transferase [Lachnospiraceae bacterium]